MPAREPLVPYVGGIIRLTEAGLRSVVLETSVAYAVGLVPPGSVQSAEHAREAKLREVLSRYALPGPDDVS